MLPSSLLWLTVCVCACVCVLNVSGQQLQSLCTPCCLHIKVPEDFLLKLRITHSTQCLCKTTLCVNFRIVNCAWTLVLASVLMLVFLFPLSYLTKRHGAEYSILPITRLPFHSLWSSLKENLTVMVNAESQAETCRSLRHTYRVVDAQRCKDHFPILSPRRRII